MFQSQYFFPPPPWFFTAPPILPQPRTISDNDTIINQGGIQGTQGIQGISGSGQGIQGTSGIDGQQGIQGVQGISGLDGLQGISGLDGLQGTSGLDGAQGIQGISGVDGLQGVNGTQGIQGLDGQQGVQGIQGVPGPINPVTNTCILPAKVITETYYVQPEDCYIGVLNKQSIEIYLPENPPIGKMLIIKAQQKQIGNKKIYIVTQNGNKIDDGDEIVLQSPYESVTLIFNDSWHITGQAQV